MKKEWLITFRSVTFAQRAERLLHSRNVPCTIQRTPKKLTERGCGYCLRLYREDILPVVELLHGGNLAFERVYERKEDGSTREWLV